MIDDFNGDFTEKSSLSVMRLDPVTFLPMLVYCSSISEVNWRPISKCWQMPGLPGVTTGLSSATPASGTELEA